jgi:YrbI family 3-deoxy-D-manno-octulosonate 8-phosphate phosphatase
MPVDFNSRDVSHDLRQLIGATRFVAFDFDGVFTDNSVFVSQDGTESVRSYRGDGIGLRKLEKLGIGLVVISTEVNPVVAVRCKKLDIHCIQGSDDKLSDLRSLLLERNLLLNQAAFVGDDVNDLDCLRNVGLPIVVQDAHPDVQAFCRYRTETMGGYGAVREVCDLFEYVAGI